VNGAPALGDTTAVKQVMERLERAETCMLDKLVAESQHEDREELATSAPPWRPPVQDCIEAGAS
jgi:hypothetical protein